MVGAASVYFCHGLVGAGLASEFLSREPLSRIRRPSNNDNDNNDSGDDEESRDGRQLHGS